MKVFLAGYNIDASVLHDLEEKSGKRDDLTPEVISAAYARISRDPRPINEIRKASREEVERSRRSNSTIIFKMGHHSVAEHAVFNLDILGISRYAMEEVEKFRLCAYTEKSQRYITLENDYVLPEEIKGTELEDRFKEMIVEQNNAYFELYDKLKEHVFTKNADLAQDPKKHNLLEGWAKEDARYITSLGTESQVGLTINARNLELMLRRFASNPLAEVGSLGRAIYEKIETVAPSIVLFHEENDRDSKTYPELKEAAASLIGEKCEQLKAGDKGDIELVEVTPGGDAAIAAALIHVSTDLPYEKCQEMAGSLNDEEKDRLFRASWKNMQFYDSMPREFEYANLTFSIVLSSACFGQLKRHRMTTITSQEYDPRLGVTVPDAVKEIGMEGFFMEIVEKTNKVYEEIKAVAPQAAPYILTNAHRKRVLVRLNAREMYHISRLREDAHSQWDIQNAAGRMTCEAKKAMPKTFAFAGGKDRFNEIYKEIFGEMPKVIEAVLPESRKISK